MSFSLIRYPVASSGSGGDFELTNGNGTTANGTEVDLGGVLFSGLTSIDGNADLTSVLAFGLGTRLSEFRVRTQDTINMSTSGALTLFASAGNINITGIDNIPEATNFLWIDTNNNVHKAAVLPTGIMPTFQQVTDVGKTTTNSITVGASTAPTQKIDVVNNGIGASTSGLGILLTNNTAASVGQAQNAPTLNFHGFSWNEFTNVSVATDWKVLMSASVYGTDLVAGTPGSSLSFQGTMLGTTKNFLSLRYGQNDVYLPQCGLTFLPNRVISAAENPGTITYSASTSSTTNHSFSAFSLAAGVANMLIAVNGITGSYGKALQVIGDASLDVFKVFGLGNVSIGPSTTPEKLAMADVNSVGRGFIAPRMTELQMNGIPKGVVSITINNAGTGYAIPPSIVVDPPTGGGLPARVHATVSGGSVTSVTVDFRGSNYVTAPGLTINNVGTGGTGNPDGINFAATALVDVLSVPAGMEVFNTTTDSPTYRSATNWQAIRHGNYVKIPQGTVSYTMLPSDEVISVDGKVTDTTILLLDPTLWLNKEVTVKRYNNLSTGKIVVDSDGSGLVQAADGVFVTDTQLGDWPTFSTRMKFKSNGTNWELIGT